MNKTEFLSELSKALSGLPDYEKYLALKYYEEYFAEAGPEKEFEAVKELGDPLKVAEQILRDFRELYIPPVYAYSAPVNEAPLNEAPVYKKQYKQNNNSVNPILFFILIILALPLSLPILALIAALIAAALVIVLAVGIVIAAVPVCLVIGGIALTICSLFVWYIPASALVTLGSGLGLLGLGVLAVMLLVKICKLFVPPLFRGFVNILRWPFVKLGIIK